MKYINLGGIYSHLQIIIDDEDFLIVSKYRWSLHTRGYAIARLENSGKRILLHRLLLGDGAETIDHRNHNKLDNRRKNLRPATRKQNLGNRKLNTNNKSGYKGVSPYRKQWRVFIAGQYIGLFPTAIVGAKAYNDKAVELYGEFAKLNQL